MRCSGTRNVFSSPRTSITTGAVAAASAARSSRREPRDVRPTGATIGLPADDAQLPFAATVALIVVLAVGGFAVLMPLAMIAIDPLVLPAPFPPQNQNGGDAQLPARVRGDPAAGRDRGAPAARRVCDRAVAAGALRPARGGAGRRRDRGRSSPARSTRGDGVTAVLIAALLWWLGAAGARRPGRAAVAGARARRSRAAWALAAAALLGALLCFADLGSVSPAGLVLGALAVAAAAALHGRVRRVAADGPGARSRGARAGAGARARPRDLPTRGGGAATRRSRSRPGSSSSTRTSSSAPPTRCSAARAMLVDTVSQYGVGSIYLLAAWFQIAPIGNGTLGLLDGRPDRALVRRRLPRPAAGRRRRGCSPPARWRSRSSRWSSTSPIPSARCPSTAPLRFGLPMALIARRRRRPRASPGGRARASARGRSGRRRAQLDLGARGVRLHRCSPSPGWPPSAPGSRPRRGRLRRLLREALAAALGLRRRARCCSPSLRSPPPASCRTGASTSRTCASSCSARLGDLTYDFAPLVAGARRSAPLPGLGRRDRRARAPRRRRSLARERRGAGRAHRHRPPTASRCSATSSTAPQTTSFPTSALPGAADRRALAQPAPARARRSAAAARVGGLALGARRRRCSLRRGRLVVGRRPRFRAVGARARGARRELARRGARAPLAPAAARSRGARRRASCSRRTCRASARASCSSRPTSGSRSCCAAAASTGCSLGDPWEDELRRRAASCRRCATPSTRCEPGDRMLLDEPALERPRRAAGRRRARPARTTRLRRAARARSQQWALQRIDAALRAAARSRPAAGRVHGAWSWPPQRGTCASAGCRARCRTSRTPAQSVFSP